MRCVPALVGLLYCLVVKALADPVKQTLRHNLKYYKVDHLKQVIAGFNEECGTNLIKSGKKQEILDRILRQLFDWRMHNEVDKWMKAKTLANRIRTTGM